MKLKKFNEFLSEDYQAYHKGEPIKNSWDRLQKTKWRPADGFTYRTRMMIVTSLKI